MSLSDAAWAEALEAASVRMRELWDELADADDLDVSRFAPVLHDPYPGGDGP